LFEPTSHEALIAITIAATHAITDTSAMFIFIMDSIDVVNKWTASKPLTINLPDGLRVRSTHVCNIAIPGLSTVLTRHILPDLAITSLVGIQPLCKVGYREIFDNNTCNVKYKDFMRIQGALY
jgi:hypothetical protein